MPAVLKGLRNLFKQGSAKPDLDEFGRSELHYAARDGDLEAMRKHLTKGADVNLADRAGCTPLHFAAQAQSAGVVQLLVEKGANVHVEDSHGNTPLWRAVASYRGDAATVEALRKAGSDPLKKNKYGVSPVASARMIANFDVAK